MKRVLVIIIGAGLLGCNSADSVYLCNGPQSKAYHKTNHCRGLKNCSTEIEATDIATAIAKHRKECGYCYD